MSLFLDGLGSGHEYTIVRPGWFDLNTADQHNLQFLQGDKRRAATPADGVIARSQIADVPIASLTSPAATNKTFELVAEYGPAQNDLEPLFAELAPDDGLDCPGDEKSQLLADEPASVHAELDQFTGIAQPRA